MDSEKGRCVTFQCLLWDQPKVRPNWKDNPDRELKMSQSNCCANLWNFNLFDQFFGKWMKMVRETF